MKIEEIMKRLSKLEDARRTDRGNIRHKLEDIIMIGLRTLICDGEDFSDMEEFGKEREEWLRKFLELPNGIPDSDTFRRVFERINPEALSECLYDWLGCNQEEGSVIAIDGKTIRGSKSESLKAYHVVSAFVAENQLMLGEVFTEEKDMSPLNLNILRKTALALCKNADFGKRVSIQKNAFVPHSIPRFSSLSCLHNF